MYNSQGQLVKETSEAGVMVVYPYDEFGNLTSVTVPLGIITGMKYDAEGQLSETIDSLKGVTATIKTCS